MPELVRLVAGMVGAAPLVYMPVESIAFALIAH